MPDEQFFRKPNTQQILLDILFIFCKLNQDVGYRQGMHELLAPILWVIELDAVNTLGQSGPDPRVDSIMLETLDSRYIEHDAFTIFSLLMQSAKSFYELGEPNHRLSTSSGVSNAQNGAAPIVERSKHIHEDLLAQVDPDLASHLTAVEVLPQIFLM
jgi:TBC1 domain family protein 5